VFWVPLSDPFTVSEFCLDSINPLIIQFQYLELFSPFLLIVQYPAGGRKQTTLFSAVKDGIPEEQKYGIIDRNYTLFRSNVLCQRGMYLVMVERRL